MIGSYVLFAYFCGSRASDGGTMAALLGMFVGSFIGTTLLGLLVGQAFKSKKPTERAAIAAVIGWLIASVVAGLGMANGGSYRFDASLYYMPGAVAAFLYLQWHYGKMWRDDEDAAD